MEKKDLSLAYALKEYARVNGESDPIFEDNRCFTFDDIKAAFNAGRESVVESLPELKWKCEYPYTADEARTPITIFHIFHNDDGFHLAGYGLGLSKMFGTLDDAKRFANEEYKNRIKQVLGL